MNTFICIYWEENCYRALDFKKVLVINGPNIDLLGTREPDIYGSTSYKDLEELIKRKGDDLALAVDCFQSNSESDIIVRVHKAKDDKTDFIIINAAAFTHTSIAIRDALIAVSIPFIEIHISNIYKREQFRHRSYLSDAALGVIVGMGVDGYLYALEKVGSILSKENVK